MNTVPSWSPQLGIRQHLTHLCMPSAFLAIFFREGLWLGLIHVLVLQSRLSTCICLYSCNDNFPTNLGLSKGDATSWLLKSTSATTFTMWNNRERSPGDAPLPPNLMNIYSEKMVGKKSGKNWLECRCPGLYWYFDCSLGLGLRWAWELEWGLTLGLGLGLGNGMGRLVL